MLVCKHVTYSGRVQGVGFRYTAEGLARDFTVAGFVRNLPSRDVELVAQGPAEEVDGFLAALAGRMEGYIQRATVREQPPGEYQGFEVRY